MKQKLKNNYKVVIGIIIGITISVGIGVSAVATKDITYDNSTSGLTSTNLQGAIDELNTKVTTKINEAEAKCPEGKICQDAISVSNSNSNIVAAYTYNSSTCKTGEESTCKQTNCINYSNRDSCDAGTIVKYKVNDSTTKYFHVLHDDGATMTLQQRENIIEAAWNSSGKSSDGPITALEALESTTSGWTNVNNQTYTMGTTNFNNTNAYTGCPTSDGIKYDCTINIYTLPSRTGKARMITMQEAFALGCTPSKQSCPNYLYDSTSSGTYITMTALSQSFVFYVDVGGFVSWLPSDIERGIRAVVVINK